MKDLLKLMENNKNISLNICAGITTFHPTEDDTENIKKLSKWFNKIYIYDNTPNSDLCFFEKNIQIIASGENNGLGVACDEMCIIAKKENYPYIMLLDQDSRINHTDLQIMSNFIIKNNQLATIYCPKICVINVEENSKIKNTNDLEFEMIKWCITSGTILRLSDYGEISFDKNYFIDRLDLDLCTQIIKNGKKICRINNAILNQQLGNNFKNGYATHSGIRHYYISRNRLYYNQKYKISNLISVLQFTKHFFYVVFYEQDKLNKISYIKEGINDFKKNKMGKKV